MRWLEVRRHSLTKKGAARGRGSHLSAEGVVIARLVGASLGPLASVVTSASPRAIETALAMGLAVDGTVDLPSGYVPGEVERHEQWSWPRPYRTYAELLGRGGGLGELAETYRAAWTQVVRAVPEGCAVWALRRRTPGLRGRPLRQRAASSGSASGRGGPITAAPTVSGDLRRYRRLPWSGGRRVAV